MDNAKIDSSLAEVRNWRKNLQEELSSLDSAAEIEEIHRRAQGLMRAHGLDLKVEHSRSHEKVSG